MMVWSASKETRRMMLGAAGIVPVSRNRTSSCVQTAKARSSAFDPTSHRYDQVGR